MSFDFLKTRVIEITPNSRTVRFRITVEPEEFHYDGDGTEYPSYLFNEKAYAELHQSILRYNEWNQKRKKRKG